MKTPIRAIRLSDERWEAYRLLLGNEWLIKQIDRAIKQSNASKTPVKTKE